MTKFKRNDKVRFSKEYIKGRSDKKFLSGFTGVVLNVIPSQIVRKQPTYESVFVEWQDGSKYPHNAEHLIIVAVGD